jgi:hypothetical protein
VLEAEVGTGVGTPRAPAQPCGFRPTMRLRVGRAGIEPATLGLRDKRRFHASCGLESPVRPNLRQSRRLWSGATEPRRPSKDRAGPSTSASAGW